MISNDSQEKKFKFNLKSSKARLLPRRITNASDVDDSALIQMTSLLAKITDKRRKES